MTEQKMLNSIIELALASVQEKFPDFVMAGIPEQLSGGFLNYVWRFKGRKGSAPESFIVKWTPAYIASAPDTPLDPDRIFIEARAMSLFEKGGALEKISQNRIRPPRLYHLDNERQLLFMEDLGPSPNLGDWLQNSHSQIEAETIGRSLGKFIGELHTATAHQSVFANMFNNAEIQRTRLDFQYKNIQSYAARAGLANVDEIGKQAVQLGERLQQPGSNLIMGDLWSLSVIVTGSGLRLIDWELAHYGHPSQDVGHFAAHLWMSSHRASTSGAAVNATTILRHFLESYCDVMGIDFDSLFGADGVRESSIHFGSEILTRTVGAFQHNYLYGGLSTDHPSIQEAVQVAAAHILNPLEMHTFDSLDWRKN
jgi:5-methylthioribose kinase